MTPQEQEKLFVQVQKRFRDRSPRWASGYVHGVVSGEMGSIEPPRFIMDGLRHRPDDYDTGFVYGFADARGEDVLAALWVGQLPFTLKVEHRWWEA